MGDYSPKACLVQEMVEFKTPMTRILLFFPLFLVAMGKARRDDLR